MSGSEVKLTSFLLKVASRCNLDCDYCYVYHHADQNWRSMPPILCQEDRDAFAMQLSSYVASTNLQRCMVIFHGGEPLLMGSSNLVAFARQLRTAVGGGVQLDISMQTNGILLSREIVDELAAADIGISLSLDGPKEVNDLHRTSRHGRSSFQQTFRALQLLKSVPEVFAGVISVIDPRTSPRQLLQFFSEHAVTRLDLLLPDAHHLRPPPGRKEQPDLYERWLIEAFDVWFDDFPHLQVRTFEALLDAVVGLPSQTDAFGFGDVSLITVETDGTYHDLDVLKVVAHGASKLIGSVRDTAIADVAKSPSLIAHRALLRKEGLCASCQQCHVVDICGGGAVPHRHGLSGFQNPTVYCREMRALIQHVRLRLKGALSSMPKQAASPSLAYSLRLTEFERAEHSTEEMAGLWSDAVSVQSTELRQTLKLFASVDNMGPGSNAARELLQAQRDIDTLAQRPGTVAWSRAMLSLGSGRPVYAVDGSPLDRDASYIESILAISRGSQGNLVEVHADDPWLRHPFGNAIVFEDQVVGQQATPLLSEALGILEAWRPALAAELRLICRAVQFVRDPNADPDKIVSFSDNSVPGALYVSVKQRDKLIDAYDLADSVLHEYRHQKLYLLERVRPIMEQTSRKVVSPWREDLRPPSGLFHAIFVFVELRRFWQYVRNLNIQRLNRRADNQLADTNTRLNIGLRSLTNCPLTPTGFALATILESASKE